MIKIKVLLVHNYYKQSGGEDKVFYEELKLLRKHGIEVVTYTVSNEEIDVDSLLNKIKVSVNTVWSQSQNEKLKKFILKEDPNVIHFHNTFPLLSPAVYYMCKKLNKPVVQTLHNYRLGCPGGLFLKDNQICEKCIEGTLLNSIKHGCYRNSKAQTIPLAAMLYTHRLLGTWNKSIDKYIALTNFAKDKFAEIGIDPNKIVVKSNFINSQSIIKEHKVNEITFVGRISQEKGVALLLKAWHNLNADKRLDTTLNIIGEGPLQPILEKQYGNLSNVNFVGKVESDVVLEYMSKSKYTVVPSTWYEGFPMTIIESYSVNTPVISSNVGSLKEVVIDGLTGFHFENGNLESLEAILKKALNYYSYSDLERNVSEEFNNKYTSNINFEQLIKIYNEVIRR